MIGYLLIGVLLAGLLLVLLNWWANAKVTSAKSGILWAIIGVCAVLTFLLLATGRGLLAIAPAGFALFRMFGPSLLSGWFKSVGNRAGQGGQSTTNMDRAEALEVLGLEDGASEAAINEAYRRLMGQVHPDKGGSDWMAMKLNAARKTLLG